MTLYACPVVEGHPLSLLVLVACPNNQAQTRVLNLVLPFGTQLERGGSLGGEIEAEKARGLGQPRDLGSCRAIF